MRLPTNLKAEDAPRPAVLDRLRRVSTPGGLVVEGVEPHHVVPPGQFGNKLLFGSLSQPQQQRLLKLVTHGGFADNGLSMAFPYMAPDNNNAFFADHIAKQFIMNKDAEASKNLYGPWRRP